MVRILALLFGAAFIFAGVVGYGYLPQFMQDGLILGYFSATPTHNLFHVVTGVVAILAASSAPLSKLFFILLGLVYAVVAGLGFFRQGDVYIMQVNMADNYLHAGIAVVALLIGFKAKND